MTEIESDKHRKLALRIAESTSDAEQEALRIWIERLLEIKSSNLSKRNKAQEAISVTQQSKVVLPTVKIIGREMKRLAWDDRGTNGRLFVGVSAVGMALFGGQGAGIAALGTAVGVPLWVVLGAGAAFIGVVYEELTGKKPPTTNYTVIDGEKTEANDDDAK